MRQLGAEVVVSLLDVCSEEDSRALLALATEGGKVCKCARTRLTSGEAQLAICLPDLGRDIPFGSSFA